MTPLTRLRAIAAGSLSLALVVGMTPVVTAALPIRLAHSTDLQMQVHAEGEQRQAAMAAVRPHLAAPSDPLSDLQDGPATAAAGLQDLLEAKATDPWLNDSVSIAVRDATTGEALVDLDADRVTVPASLTKIVSAAAVLTVIPGRERLQTRAVQGETADQIVLVAGGDSLLAAGPGDPDAVIGRAGLADLAEQVALELPEGQGAPEEYRVLVDTGYAEGPDQAPGWTEFWVDFGYTGRITMLGLASDRALPGEPAPADPAAATAVAFAEALREAGVPVREEEAEDVARVSTPASGQVWGQVSSAPMRDILTLALSESDNALTEQLTRQAAARAGVGTDVEEVASWVGAAVGSHYGIELDGVTLADTSGLSDGTTIPMRVIADLLVLGAGGEYPDLQDVLGGLPVAGYSGTLRERFHLEIHEEAVGVARAKTGSLPGISALGGYVVSADGELLAFAVVADEVGPDGAVLEARSVLDEMVAIMAGCGC